MNKYNSNGTFKKVSGNKDPMSQMTRIPAPYYTSSKNLSRRDKHRAGVANKSPQKKVNAS